MVRDLEGIGDHVASEGLARPLFGDLEVHLLLRQEDRSLFCALRRRPAGVYSEQEDKPKTQTERKEESDETAPGVLMGR